MLEASRMCVPFLNSTETRSAASTMNSIVEPADSYRVEDSDDMTLLDFICKNREYTALPSATKPLGKRSFSCNNVINEDMTSSSREKAKRLKGVCSKKKTKTAMEASSEKTRIVAGQQNDCDDDWTLEMWQKTGRHLSKPASNDCHRCASESKHTNMHTQHVPKNVATTIASSTIIHQAKSVDPLSNGIADAEFNLPVSFETNLIVEQGSKVDFINGIAASSVNVSSSSCPASDPSNLKSPNYTKEAVALCESITNKDCENLASYVPREGKDNLWTSKCISFGEASIILQGAFCKTNAHSLTSKGLEEEREGRNEKCTDDGDQSTKPSTAEVDSATISMGIDCHLPTHHNDENDEMWIKPMLFPLSCRGSVEHVPDIMQNLVDGGTKDVQAEISSCVTVKDRDCGDHVSGDGNLVLLENLKESVPFPLTASTFPSEPTYDENANRIEDKASDVPFHSDQSLPFKIESHLNMHSLSRGALSVEKIETPNKMLCEKNGVLTVYLENKPQKYYQQVCADQTDANCKIDFNLTSRDHKRFNFQPLGLHDFIGQESAPIKLNQTRLEISREATGCLKASDSAMHSCVVTSVQRIQQTSDQSLESVEQCQGMVQAIYDFDANDLTEVSYFVDNFLMEDEWISSDETCTSNQFMENREFYWNDEVPSAYDYHNQGDHTLELAANTNDHHNSAKICESAASIASSLGSQALESHSTDISSFKVLEVDKDLWDKQATPSQYPRKRQAISPLSQEKLLRATGRDAAISGTHSSSGTGTAYDQVDEDESHCKHLKNVLGTSGLDVGAIYASTSVNVHSGVQEKTHLGSPSYYQSSLVKHQTYTSQSPYSHSPSSLSTLSDSFTEILSQGSSPLQENLYEAISLVLPESPTQELSVINKCSIVPPCKVALAGESSPKKES